MITHEVKYVIDWALLGKWSNASNIVIALFAGAVCFVYWKQLATMRITLAEIRASNEIADHNLKLGRRSWLVLSKLRAPSTFVADEPWEFRITVKNCGGIPATTVACRYSVLMVEGSTPLPEAQEMAVNLFKTPAIGVAAMAPGKTHVTGVGQGLNFSKDRLEQIASGAVKMYLYCHFGYRDVLLDQLEPNRWSSGCWRFWTVLPLT
jgi:hypothetical protein